MNDRIDINNEYRPVDRNFRPPPWLADEMGYLRNQTADICAPTFTPGSTIRTVDERGLFPIAMQQKYSLRKAILDAANEDGQLHGCEAEVSRELELKIGRAAEGFYVPQFAFRADLAAGTGPTSSSGTAGQSFVPLIVEPSLIELLRPWTVCVQSGATLMSGLTGSVSIPRMTAANTATWAAENAQINRTSPTFDQIQLQPSRLGIVTAYSKSLLAQSTLDVENIVREDQLRVIAIGIDNAALQGSGTSNQPLGLLNLTANTAGSYDPTKRSPNTTFAGVATYDSVLRMIGNLEDSNVLDDGTFGYVVTPKTKARWKVIPRAVNYPLFLWEQKEKGREVCGMYQGHFTKLIDATTPGQVIAGKWSDLVIGQWAGVDCVVDPYSLADTWQIRVVTHALVAIGFRHAISFVVSTDTGAA
jgi:hypothetical protein